MKKIILKLSFKQLQKIKLFFDNIFYSQRNKIWYVEIYSEKIKEDRLLLENFLNLKIKKIVEQIDLSNLLNTTSKQKDILIENIYITQTKSTSFYKNLIIPCTGVFGTGHHVSTKLAIVNILFCLKKKKFNNVLDLGSGTGILAFIIYQKFRTKIIASDIDDKVKYCFDYNKKLNNFSGLKFVRADGFNSKIFLGKKFDFIVSNILLNPLKRIAKNIYLHLKKNGILIVSGILKSQKNDLISHYTKFNLKIIKSIYIEEWVSIIFKKNERN